MAESTPPQDIFNIFIFYYTIIYVLRLWLSYFKSVFSYTYLIKSAKMSDNSYLHDSSLEQEHSHIVIMKVPNQKLGFHSILSPQNISPKFYEEFCN